MRGLFQAAFLRSLEREVPDLSSSFDLIAATSTGAFVGLAVAADVPMSDLVDLYREHAPRIFRPKTGAWLRRGSRYSSDRLRAVLTDHFGERTLGDLRPGLEVVICASTLNRYQGKTFTRADKDTLLIDAALASAAAPTFFAPVVPEGGERGYLDGGLWANDPLLVAIAYASRNVGVDTAKIDALSIGTGRTARGRTPADVARLRLLSFGTARLLMEISGSLQEWSTRDLVERLTEAKVRRINPDLVSWVELDNAKRAISELPGIAEGEYEQFGSEIAMWLRASREDVTPDLAPLSPELEMGIRTAGLSRVIPARRHYSELRDGYESISAYIARAKRTLTMVSINLATGSELERIERMFETLLDRDPPVRVRISLIDYEDEALVDAVARILGQSRSQVRERVAGTMEALVRFRSALDVEKRDCLELFRHRTIPPASAILIDVNSSDGAIQLETKPYNAPPTESWGLEIEAGTPFFETQRKAYHDLIGDGEEVRDGCETGRDSETREFA